jgi:hypothetical protein
MFRLHSLEFRLAYDVLESGSKAKGINRRVTSIPHDKIHIDIITPLLGQPSDGPHQPGRDHEFMIIDQRVLVD